jgi:hypothetical protein
MARMRKFQQCGIPCTSIFNLRKYSYKEVIISTFWNTDLISFSSLIVCDKLREKKLTEERHDKNGADNKEIDKDCP